MDGTVEKYLRLGTPLTPYEDELVTILIEECAEIIQAATKLQRFGREKHPRTGVDNTQYLSDELGDLCEVHDMLLRTPLVDVEQIARAQLAKRERLARYMQHEEPPRSVGGG